MFNKLFLVINVYLLVGYALPADQLTNLNESRPEGIKHSTRALPVLKIDYKRYPESAENICYSWHCNKGPRKVAPNRGAADANRDSNSCGSWPNRCSTEFKPSHGAGYQCDEWPWANSNAGGRNVATRYIVAHVIPLFRIRFSLGKFRESIFTDELQNRGPQKPGYVLRNGIDFAEIKVVNIPNNAHFCLAELPGLREINAMITSYFFLRLFFDATAGISVVCIAFILGKAPSVDIETKRRILPSSVADTACADLGVDGMTKALNINASFHKTLSEEYEYGFQKTDDTNKCVPMPKDAALNLIRIEMLGFGAEYAWLVVLCLRRKAWDEDPRSNPNQEEWDRSLSQNSEKVVYYFRGLGLPLSFKRGDFGTERYCFNRAWTLHEMKLWNWYICNTRGTSPQSSTTRTSPKKTPGQNSWTPCKIGFVRT
ncbi:deoxyribonuclease NucA/NucB-domain-containing protein [Armillaria luteobubalina]|uniref:Deoxyribonuclease NucA/NucB-domain-containing protein n=1 Tax=Armillaria luteobubalina TaxID=153913 RepID=A0AA39PD44_9AGAR|nr:deoxyribonuclease NucA/NucB-domain-containing protein [Armillaria luteobubalina]